MFSRGRNFVNENSSCIARLACGTQAEISVSINYANEPCQGTASIIRHSIRNLLHEAVLEGAA
jgi:hypothetical protein